MDMDAGWERTRTIWRWTRVCETPKDSDWPSDTYLQHVILTQVGRKFILTVIPGPWFESEEFTVTKKRAKEIFAAPEKFLTKTIAAR